MDLTDKDRELVDGKNFAHVSTPLPDGAPKATVVWVDEREGGIRFNSSESSAKAKNVRRDPRVAVSVHVLADRSRVVARPPTIRQGQMASQ